MADFNRSTNSGSFLEEPKKMPNMINVLSILTFIGCGIFGLLSLFGFAKAKANYEAASTIDVDKLPGFMKNMMGSDYVEKARIAYENRVPILLMALIGFAACTYGAIQMRQLKKNGFYIYAIGEIVIPLLSIFLFLGASSVASFSGMLGLCIYVLFTVLYATQLKYLK